MGLIKDQNVEDEYTRILDDMGFDLPDHIEIEEDKEKEKSKENNKKED